MRKGEGTLVKINGELRDVTGKTVSECLAADGYDVKRVAVGEKRTDRSEGSV